MNWIKRAFRSISYHKKNTILMFLSFLILSILILFGLCIRAASRERSMGDSDEHRRKRACIE